MAGYDPYDSPTRDRRYDDRGARYTETRESQHLKVYPPSRDLIPRHRDSSDLSIEEVHRDFPPPGYRDVRRARSAEPGYYDYDARDPRYDREHRHRQKKAADYYEDEERRKRVLSKQEKILAAFAGAALALGGKEVYDRHEAKGDGHEVDRNYLHSAALGAAGLLAGYQGAELYNKHAGKEEKKGAYALHRGRDGRIQEAYYSDDDDDIPAKKGHKKFLESILGVTSMGAAVKALTGGGDDSKSSRGRGRSRSSSRSSKSRGQSRSKLQKAAMASLIAGATEAFRVSKEPGGWKGEKAKRVVTAAIGAGALGTAHDDGHSKKDIFESVVGGLVGNRLMHGSKKNIEEDERDPGRSRSRSRARSEGRGGRGGGGGGGGSLAALAATGLGALAAKKAVDSRSRSRSRRRGSSSDGSRSPSHRRHRSRSRSVVDKARKRLAKIGIGNGPESDDDGDYEESRQGSSRRDRGSVDDNYYDDDHRGSSRRDRPRDRGAYPDDDRSYRPSRRRGGKSDAGSESDLGDSSDDERRAKKMKGKQILTTGLATVATIHAAHEVYQSMEKRTQRQKAVREGRLSPEEAKKLKTKAILQDAASVGIAALGIKGAVSELKEAREISHECKEFQQQKKLRQQKRRERQRRLNNGPSQNSSARTDRRGYDYDDYDDYEYDDGYYPDGNPYAATLPAPPVGYHNSR